MKKTIITLLIIIVIAPIGAYSAQSQWYWVSNLENPEKGYFIEDILPNTIGYSEINNTDSSDNKTLISEDFMKIMGETDNSRKCSGELDSAIKQLRQFDSQEVLIDRPSRCRFDDCEPSYIPQAMTQREKLLRDIEDEAKECLIKEEKEIEEAEEEREQAKEEKKHLRDVQEAVKNCDFKFFTEKMTNRERMNTYKERTACKQNVTLIKETAEPEQKVVVDKTELLKQIQSLLALVAKLQLQLSKQ